MTVANGRTQALLHETRDDTVFLGMADFLTLLSICFIFVALQLPVAMPAGVSEGIQAVKVGQGSGPSRQIDDSVAYVAVFPGQEKLVVRILLAGSGPKLEKLVDKHVPIEQESEVLDWIAETIGTRGTIEKVVVHLAKQSAPDSAHRLVNNIASVALKSYKVYPAFEVD